MRHEQIGDAPHTTCVVGAYSRSEPRSENWVPGTATWDTSEAGDKLGMPGFILLNFIDG